MLHVHTTKINTWKTVFFYQKATISALYMLHLTTPSFRYRTKPWAKYHNLPMQHLWKWGRLGSKGSSMWQLLRLVSHILHAYQLVPLQHTPKIKHIMDMQQLWHTKFLKQHFRVCWSYYTKLILRHLWWGFINEWHFCQLRYIWVSASLLITIEICSNKKIRQ
jgi:hypothetical protein